MINWFELGGGYAAVRVEEEDTKYIAVKLAYGNGRVCRIEKFSDDFLRCFERALKKYYADMEVTQFMSCKQGIATYLEVKRNRTFDVYMIERDKVLYKRNLSMKLMIRLLEKYKECTSTIYSIGDYYLGKDNNEVNICTIEGNTLEEFKSMPLGLFKRCIKYLPNARQLRTDGIPLERLEKFSYSVEDMQRIGYTYLAKVEDELIFCYALDNAAFVLERIEDRSNINSLSINSEELEAINEFIEGR